MNMLRRLLCNQLVGRSLPGIRLSPFVNANSYRRFSESTVTVTGTGTQLPAVVLPYKRLAYNSAKVDVAALRGVEDTAEFTAHLWNTIAELRKAGVDALYLSVPMLYAHLIPATGVFGFRYHHAEDETVVLLLWLGSAECKV